eukprot:2930432-Pleurochrysis_carterae.AAC.1
MQASLRERDHDSGGGDDEGTQRKKCSRDGMLRGEHSSCARSLEVSPLNGGKDEQQSPSHVTALSAQRHQSAPKSEA